MILRIKNILERILFRNTEEILFSPTRQELRSELNFTSEMRLVIDPVTNNYFIADASKYDHVRIMKEAGIYGKQNIEGGLYDDGFVWIRGNTIQKYNNRDMTLREQEEWMRSTNFYTNLDGFITELNIQNAFDWGR
jgi:hypothetical protein